MKQYIEKKISKNRNLVKKIKSLARKIGLNLEHWERYPTYKIIKSELVKLNLKSFDTLEISAGEYWRENYIFKSYEEFNYPEYDICGDVNIKKKYDFIIADNVWEHLKFPYKATRNIYNLLNKNGYFLVIVPFLIRVHNVPIDCTRWTEDGIRYFLYECGFELKNIYTNSWGNKECVKSNLRSDDTWTRIGFYKNLKNDKKFPVQVWALAQKKYKK